MFKNPKKIIVFADFRDFYSLEGLKIILKKKFFLVSAIITTKKNISEKKDFFKNIKIFYDGFPHKNKNIINFIKKENIQLSILTAFTNRIRYDFIKLFKQGIFNIHPAVLPSNKGSHSSFYTILNNTDIGATLYLINKDFDSGPILDQTKIKNNIFFDAEYVYKKSRECGLKLLNKNLKNIYLNKFKTKLNKKTKINYKKNIIKFNVIEYNKKYSGKFFWNLIRAVHFKDNGFFIKIKNKKVKIIPKIIK